SEETLANAELELNKYRKRASELTREVDELRKRADETDRLKDELDGLRHAEKERNKMKIALDKCKEKMQEDANLRQRHKLLEQNARLANTALDEERRRNSSLTSLVEDSRKQISDLSREADT
ncbi:hypothetical protein DENSPDRAFT_743293, partial [Dentipellis sp. KUC8613]